MGTTITLSALRDSVRQRADMMNSLFVSDAELNSYIQASYYELYDLLIQKYGDNYFVATPYTFSTTGAAQYALPADFYKLLGIDIKPSVSSVEAFPMKSFTFAERDSADYNGCGPRYRINGNNIWFTPLPSAGQTIQLWYIPRATVPVEDGDTIDGISGWEEYVVIDAAIKCLQKEESDVSILMAQKNGLIVRLESVAENRDAGSPATVADSRSGDYGGAAWFGGVFY